MNIYPHLFSPLTIRGKTLRNRIQFSPHVSKQVMSDGEISIDKVNYLEMQAKMGVAYITIGDTQVDRVRAACFGGEVNVTDDRYIPGLYKAVEAVRRHGALLSVELSHAGAGAVPSMCSAQALSPSGIPVSPTRSQDPKVMDRADMDEARDKWVDACKRCVKAGFEMLMIHSAHQNLLAQFLSPLTNKRTDEYGGSLENRMRYPLEVVKAIREAVGENVILEIRISSREELEGGMTEDEMIEYAKRVEPYVDIIHVSRGTIFNREAGNYTIPPLAMGPRLNAEYAAKFKKHLHVPVAVPGNILTLADAEAIIASGQADIVSMARSLMADQDIIWNAMAGHPERTRPCMRCMQCCNRVSNMAPVRCAINPLLGRETEFKTFPKTSNPRKVVIVGGGVAGMMAAQTCRKVGHEVVLFEKSNVLGGLIDDASALPEKYLMKRYFDWDVRETLNCGADIRFNTEATIDLIDAEAPDAVILATGSTHLRPDIPGIDNALVKTVSDANHGRIILGDRVVVCGAGTSGLEIALELARQGKSVTVVDQIPVESFGRDMVLANWIELNKEMKRRGVKLMGSAKIVEFEEDGVVVERGGEREKLEADNAVLALGVKPYNPLEAAVHEKYPMSTFVIGDCSGPRGDIFRANEQGFFAALNVDGIKC